MSVVVRENSSFIWTHRISIQNSLGWTREEQERIVSAILDMEWQFRNRDRKYSETISATAKIKSNWFAYPWPHVYMEVLRINANAYIIPFTPSSTIEAKGRIQPSIGGNAKISFGEEIEASARISQGEEISSDARIRPIIVANGNIIQPDLEGRARIVYPRLQAICGNGAIAIGEWDITLAEQSERIGRQRGCDLKGDLPMTGWRFIREGRPEKIQHWSSTKRITRWISRCTEIQFWFNPINSDPDGDKMVEAITNLLDYYYNGKIKPYYYTSTQFKVKGDFRTDFVEGIEVQINSPEDCCKAVNKRREEWEELMEVRRLNPFVESLASVVTDTISSESNIKTKDLFNATVIRSSYEGGWTIVELDSSYEIKNTLCATVAWRSPYSSISIKKHYYPFSANARIQAYIRNTGKLYWLLGPPNQPGNETEYAYKILEVGE